ncbi:MAG: tetratricopeptide repeat protein [Armatimonadetes bacterium]|nr:tetratricopeptide repeat protein [Armatimonadota bacterium]
MFREPQVENKESPKFWRVNIILGLLLVILTIATFWQVQGHGFVFDDQAYIVENPRLQHPPTLDDIKWALTTNYAGFWHPIVWLSYMVDVKLQGSSPRGFHLTNLLLHIFNTLLLFSFLSKATKSVWRSAFVAGLFAIHPLHVESVAWVAERKDLLSTLFWMLTLLAYLRYVHLPRVRTYLSVIVFFVLGLMSKPMLVTLPFLLLLLDWWPLQRTAFVRFPQPTSSSEDKKTPVSRLVIEKIPLFILSAVFSVLAYVMQESNNALSGGFTFGIRFGNAIISYAGYIWKMIWPRNLSAFYPHPGHNLPIWQAIAAGVILLLVSVFALRSSKKMPYMGVGWLWYLGTLVPVIGFVQVGMFSMADRFTYVPLIGLFIMIAWGLPDLICRAWLDEASNESENKRSPILIFTACACIIAFALCAWIQVGYWHDNIKLFKRAIAVTSNNALACNNLGLAYERLNQIDDAIIWYSRALEIEPLYPFAHLNLGRALKEVGSIGEAVEHYIAAVQIKPDFAEAHNNLASILASKGKINEAIEEYQKAIAANPNYAEAHYNLALLLSEIGRFNDAVAHYKEALRLNPLDADVLCNLGLLFIQKRDFRSAEKHLHRAISIQPQMAEAHYGLAVILAVHGKHAEALHEIELCRKYGYAPNPELVRIINSKYRKFKPHHEISIAPN